MYILGIQNAADSGVCLMKDGVVLDAVNEERFNRVKLTQGGPNKVSPTYWTTTISRWMTSMSLPMDGMAATQTIPRIS